ncbi:MULTISPECIES: DUF6470 family protein [Paenibacillus]|uniref:DUF6470 family protein n=1 Tax=Paenibacillus TaxID=44249 RepID=UPI00048B60F8|nr:MULTISPECIES: DUF6470 family protein [Paenibacillus]
MNIPQIQIHQGFSRIAIKTTKGQWSIKQPKPSMNLHQELGELTIERTKSSLDIDQRKAWSALGRAKIDEFCDRISQSALESSMQNIAEIAQAGDRMMAIHLPGNAFAEIARQNAFKDRPIEFRGEARYDNVDITYTPGTLSISYFPKKVTAEPETHKPIIDYYPGKVNPYLIQKNFIFITATGRNLDEVV